MRITIVSDVCYPTVCDGVASILTNLVRELNAKGHQIQLIAPEGSFMEGVELVCLRAVPVAKTDNQVMPFFSPRMFLQIRKFNPEFILFLDPRFLAIQSIFLFRLFFGKRKLLATFHTDNFQYLKILFGVPYFFSKWLHRIVFGNFSRIISVSDYCKNLLVQAGLKNCDGIWSGGLDTQLFHPEKRSESVRQSLLQTGEHTLSLHVGRLSREKGIDRLVPLFAESKARGVRWVIVGDGDDREALEAAAQGFPVTFVGKKYGDELAALYASADFFAFPSTTDTFGLVVVEAMSSGIPVVAFNHGAVPNLIRHGVDGLIVKNTDEALLEGFIQLAENASQRTLLGTNARAVLANKWAWSSSVQYLLDLVEPQSVPSQVQSAAK